MMDEKTSMTVEFLRARLLSERNVSRTARQRADLFAQRVMELEEKLRIVNDQRKKSEKAAEDVLAILETLGISHISELTDSSTEQEGNHHSLNEDAKENGFLTVSDSGKSEVDDSLPSSEIDGHLSEHKVLTWKFRGTKLDSQEKQRVKQSRHRNRSDFVVDVKPSQQRLGKSCRKIKRPDAGSSSENELHKGVFDSHGNGMVAMPNNFDGKPGYPLVVSESKIQQFSTDFSVSSSLDVRNGEDNNVMSVKDDGGMERALEQQAQLIGQFQAMENAQREWEEKFKESKISMQGNQNGSSAVDNSSNVVSRNQQRDDKLFVEDVSFSGHEKTGTTQSCESLNKREVGRHKFPSPETTATSLALGQQSGAGSTGEAMVGPSLKLHDLVEQRYSARVPSQGSSRGLHGSVYEKKQSEFIEVKELPRLRSKGGSRSLGSVLQSLQQARLSIKQELTKHPALGDGTLAIVQPRTLPSRSIIPSSKALDLPTGPPGLFTLPTDSVPQAQYSGANFFGSGLRLTATRPDLGLATALHSVDGDCSDRLPAAYGERYSAAPCVKKGYCNRNSASTVSAASAHEYSRHRPGLSADRLSLQNELTKPALDWRTRLPYDDRFSYGRDYASLL